MGPIPTVCLRLPRALGFATLRPALRRLDSGEPLLTRAPFGAGLIRSLISQSVPHSHHGKRSWLIHL